MEVEACGNNLQENFVQFEETCYAPWQIAGWSAAMSEMVLDNPKTASELANASWLEEA